MQGTVQRTGWSRYTGFQIELPSLDERSNLFHATIAFAIPLLVSLIHSRTMISFLREREVP